VLRTGRRGISGAPARHTISISTSMPRQCSPKAAASASRPIMSCPRRVPVPLGRRQT